jgi:hypothetical protein
VDGGIDVQYGARIGNYMTLTGPNSLTILGNNSKPQDEWGNYGIRANSYQIDMYSAQVKVLSEVPTIVLFSPTAGSADPQNENRGRISHYGSQHPSSSVEQALLTASIGFSTRGPGAIGADGAPLNAAIGEHEFRVGFNINGRTNGNVYTEDTAFLISRKDTDLRGQGSIKYRLPLGLTAANSSQTVRRVVIDNATGELRQGPIIGAAVGFVPISYPLTTYQELSGSTLDSPATITLGAGTWVVHVVIQRENSASGSGSEDIRASVAKTYGAVTPNVVQIRKTSVTVTGGTVAELQVSTDGGSTWEKIVREEGTAMNAGFFGWAMRVL